MARTITVSEFALKLDHSLRIGSNMSLITIDQFLEPVRECLARLTPLRVDGEPCWCPSAFLEQHTPTCNSAKDLWNSLKAA